MKLTEKQRRFVDAYMGDAAGNATEAARRAGYKGSDKTLSAVGAENLGKPGIAAAIKEIVDDDPAIATREDRQRFWSTVMWETGEKMADRLKASELLGKTQLDFVERHRHEGSAEHPIYVKGDVREWTDERIVAELARLEETDDA